MPVIEVVNLRKKYGDNEALKGISFRVRPGEIYGLLGPNGAGKSTAIGILCGLVKPDAGQASLKGIDIARHPVEARRVLGVVPQEVALYSEFSARDNLKFFGQLYGLSGARLTAAIDQVLRKVEPCRPGEGAHRELFRRHAAAIEHRCRAAARAERRADGRTDGRPRPADARAILDLVRSIASGGAAVVYTTHYLDEAEHLCDRIGIIDHGAILAEGTLQELRQAAGAREIIALRGTFRAETVAVELEKHAEYELIKATESELLLTVQRAEQQLTGLLAVAATLGTVREVAIRQPEPREPVHQADGPGTEGVETVSIPARAASFPPRERVLKPVVGTNDAEFHGARGLQTPGH